MGSEKSNEVIANMLLKNLRKDREDRYRSGLFVTSELYTKDLATFLRRRLFQDIDIFFKMAGSGLAPASEDVRSFTVLLSGSKDHICLFTATELRSCTASFETTGNLEKCTFLR